MILNTMVSLLLSLTFACGLFIAVAHVLNHSFIAPVYDVVANLTAFTSATAASALLGHWLPTCSPRVPLAAGSGWLDERRGRRGS